MFVLRKLQLFLLVALCLPSCLKYHKILESEVPQGDEKKKNLDVVANNLRSAPVYDQFTTKAIFDVLWMSDEAREHYSGVFSSKHGHNEQAYSALIRRQLEENKHWVSFYILAYTPETNNQALNDKDSVWSLYLELPGRKSLAPSEVKEVELAPEIQYFFGNRFTRFKTAYLARFNIENDSVREDVKHKQFKLMISSVDRDVQIKWGEKPSSDIKVKKKTPVSTTDRKYQIHEDFYWV